MNFTRFFTEPHNQNHRNSISGAGVHSGSRGSASKSTPIIPDLQTQSYTQANLYRDLQTNTVPEKRDKRKNVDDVINKMGNHHDKYIDRSLAHHGDIHHGNNSMVTFELNHINRK